MESTFFVLRKLTESELGWFAEPRRMGKAKGRQRGINFNATEMERIFPEEILGGGDIPVVSRRLSDGQVQSRRIRLQEKNWRLVGDKVSGVGLELLEKGDLFWGEITVGGDLAPCSMVWDVVTKAGASELHERITREFSVFLAGRMASWPSSDPVADYLGSLVGLRPSVAKPKVPRSEGELAEKSLSRGVPARSPASKPLPSPAVTRPRRKRIEDRLRRPHILAEILKSGTILSASAQANFIDILDTLSSELRTLLLDGSLICRVEINHRKTWAAFRGVPIGFVDGGMANVSSLGAAPVAIRVGSYVVIPGDTGPDRERFDFEIQLVDDLYESATGGTAIYEDLFEDVAKMRDAARISCEVGGMLFLTRRADAPEIAVLHGPLVNPVSPYALGIPGMPGSFPNFTRQTISKLLPGETKPRNGRDANFVSVYLAQLEALKCGNTTVCGVVERPSSAAPGPLSRALIERMQVDGLIDATTRREFLDKMEGYHITDSIIFECVLDEGEYVSPTELDKQGPDHKIPDTWTFEIKSYPKPLTTYVKSNAETMPVRVEAFGTGRFGHCELMNLIVHTSRLLPRYSFPVGLDIVDKHAKVPDWMSRQIGVLLSAQLMRKAMDTGNPAAIRLVRRILSTTPRDWLFRPNYRKG